MMIFSTRAAGPLLAAMMFLSGCGAAVSAPEQSDGSPHSGLNQSRFIIGEREQVRIRDFVVRSGWPSHRAWYLPNFVDADATAPARTHSA